MRRLLVTLVGAMMGRVGAEVRQGGGGEDSRGRSEGWRRQDGAELLGSEASHR
jgi:hypothetical protein